MGWMRRPKNDENSSCDGRIFKIPLGSLGDVIDVESRGFTTTYGVRSIREPLQVVFVSASWVLPAPKELQDLPTREERVRYLELHPDPNQARIRADLDREGEEQDTALAAEIKATETPGEGVTVRYSKTFDCTTALLTLKAGSTNLFIAYKTKGGPKLKPCKESVPVLAFLCGPWTGDNTGRVMFPGTPLPEYKADSMTIDDRPALAFTMQSGGLYNLTKQDKSIPISNGTRRIGELSPSHQEIIERFLQTMAHPERSAEEEPQVVAKPAQNRVRETDPIARKPTTALRCSI